MLANWARVMWGILAAIGGRLLPLINWLDIHAGAIQAVTAIVVAYFTFQLVSTSRRQWRAARQAADAATLSAQAAIAFEAPFLRVLSPELLSVSEPVPETGPYAGNENDGTPTPFSTVSWIEVRNLGRSPAFPIEASFGWTIGRELPGKPRFNKSVLTDPQMNIPPDSKKNIVSGSITIHADLSQIRDLSENRQFLWFYGEILYLDLLERRHRKRFCFKWWCPDGVGMYFFAHSDEIPAAYTSSEIENTFTGSRSK